MRKKAYRYHQEATYDHGGFFYHCSKQDVKLFEYTGVYRVDELYKSKSLSAKKLSENRIS